MSSGSQFWEARNVMRRWTADEVKWRSLARNRSEQSGGLICACQFDGSEEARRL